MNDSIFESLQVVQVTDDDAIDLIEKPAFHQNIDKLHNSYDPEQNAHLKVSCSTRPSVLMTSSLSQKSKSSFTRHSIPSRKSINHENNNHQVSATPNCTQLRKLNDGDKFICQSCTHQSNQSCQICNGKTQLNGNDKIIKFFEYILEFKLGKIQSYRPKQQKLLSRRTKPNDHCNIYYSTINPKLSILERPEPTVRFSINNDKPNGLSVLQHDQRLKNCKQIHHGYCCDQCQMDPIQGPRYHCDTCEDFDLCEQCYLKTRHSHQLHQVQLKKGNKCLQKMSNLLKNANMSTLRSSIRNNQSMRSTMINSKACKSWIR